MAHTRIGALRHRLALQSRADTPSGDDDLDTAYTTIATVYGAIDPIASIRNIGTAQIEDGVTHQATIRRRTDTSSWRYVLWDSRRFRVRGTQDLDDRKRFMSLTLEELGAGS